MTGFQLSCCIWLSHSFGLLGLEQFLSLSLTFVTLACFMLEASCFYRRSLNLDFSKHSSRFMSYSSARNNRSGVVFLAIHPIRSTLSICLVTDCVHFVNLIKMVFPRLPTATLIFPYMEYTHLTTKRNSLQSHLITLSAENVPSQSFPCVQVWILTVGLPACHLT
jgi:hypothetical protein